MLKKIKMQTLLNKLIQLSKVEQIYITAKHVTRTCPIGQDWSI